LQNKTLWPPSPPSAFQNTAFAHALFVFLLYPATCSGLKLLPLEGAALYRQQQAEEGGEAAGDTDESVDVEALSNNTNGVVFFNGGSYSAGPDFIGGVCGILHVKLLQLLPQPKGVRRPARLLNLACSTRLILCAAFPPRSCRKTSSVWVRCWQYQGS